MTEEKKTFICLKDAISVVYRTKHMVDLTDSMKSVVIAKDAIVLGLEKLPTIEEPKKGHCKDCKWWKDSDDMYRRGCGAESKCPINRRKVFDGKGYCYLFEPQESEGEE